MVIKKKGLVIAVATVVVIAGLIYAANRKMNGSNGNKGQHNLYHPIGGNYPQTASNMQSNNDTASFSASSSSTGGGCGCSKKRTMI